jgi:hypothetical protein
MDVIDRKTDKELLQSMIGEIAKATNELRCARGDLDKATGRLSFLLVVANKMLERQGD